MKSSFTKRSNAGFTLLEMLVVSAIIALLSSSIFAAVSIARRKANDTRRVADLASLRTALESFSTDRGRYPSTGGSWRSQCNAWGGYDPEDVIPGLVPSYVPALPRDPMMSKTASICCYTYASDGTDYKLLIHACTSADYPSQPQLIDPARDGGTDSCTIDGTPSSVWSWAIYSAGAQCW